MASRDLWFSQASNPIQLFICSQGTAPSAASVEYSGCFSWRGTLISSLGSQHEPQSATKPAALKGLPPAVTETKTLVFLHSSVQGVAKLYNSIKSVSKKYVVFRNGGRMKKYLLSSYI